MSKPYLVKENDQKLTFDTKIICDMFICLDLELWSSITFERKNTYYTSFLSGDIICELAHSTSNFILKSPQVNCEDHIKVKKKYIGTWMFIK